MGILDRFFGGAPATGGSNVDEAMNALEDDDLDVMHQAADYYVKPLSLEGAGDMAIVEGELKAKNVVLLNIASMARNPAQLKDSLNRLSGITQAVGGDIARISEDKILITPSRMRIARSKPRA